MKDEITSEVKMGHFSRCLDQGCIILSLYVSVLLGGWQLFLREIIPFHTFPPA